MSDLKKCAEEMSKRFLEEEKEYRLGFLEAEQTNPKTKYLGESFVENTRKGVETLLCVDADLCTLFEKTLNSEQFDLFYTDVLNTLKNGGRIVISGCGSTGRLAMRIEASFRIAVKQLSCRFPEAEHLKDSVIALMTGGDYAIIRAVESFEDYIQLGEMQAKELNMGEKDLLVGVTATGETTSILGTACQALTDGSKVWMIVCTKPESIVGKLKRAKDLYLHENCKSLYMNCGGMAVTGSTRMQSSTIEQAVISAALELALGEIFDGTNKTDKEYLVEGFKNCIGILKSEENINSLVKQVEDEKAVYEAGRYVTYFADEYLLDVLADTTERGPTFSVPAFRPQNRTDLPLSLAFVKNPFADTEKAWYNCFERVPRCIDKTADEYKEIGIKDDDIRRIPKINLDALYEYKIGCEKDAEREKGGSLGVWIGFEDDAPNEFYDAVKDYGNTSVLVVKKGEKPFNVTRLKMFEHLAVKLALNTFSTGTMAKMGRILGNYMVYINITNKKLVDRATRIVSDLCEVSYEKANYELFYSRLLLEQKNIEGKAAIETIKRLKGEN